jgi:hypothetical protein
MGFIIIAIGILLILFGVNYHLQKKRNMQEKLEDLLADFDANNRESTMDIYINTEGTDQDEIPNGIGEFGHSKTNAIPTHKVAGSYQYLNNLKTKNNKAIQYSRVGSLVLPYSKFPIDEYDIFENDKKIATIYISAYHKKNSNKAPKGFSIIN